MPSRPPRCLRLLFWIVVYWLVLAFFWVFLPSIQYSEDALSRALSNGERFLRVYDIYSRPNRVYANIILSYEVHTDADGQKILSFGGGRDILRDMYPGTYRNIPTNDNLTLRIPDPSLPITVSPPYGLRVGYYWIDSFWNMRSFPTADAALLEYWMYHMVEDLHYRIRRVPSENLIEIWQECDFWKLPLEPPTTPPDLEPLLSIQFVDGSPKFTFPSSPISSSPSKLYPIRLALFFALIPLTYLAIGILIGFLYAFFGVFYAVPSVLGLCFKILAIALCTRMIYWLICSFNPTEGVKLPYTRDMEWLASRIERAAGKNRDPHAPHTASELEAEAEAEQSARRAQNNPTTTPSEAVLVDV